MAYYRYGQKYDILVMYRPIFWRVWPKSIFAFISFAMVWHWIPWDWYIGIGIEVGIGTGIGIGVGIGIRSAPSTSSSCGDADYGSRIVLPTRVGCTIVLATTLYSIVSIILYCVIWHSCSLVLECSWFIHHTHSQTSSIFWLTCSLFAVRFCLFTHSYVSPKKHLD